MRVKQHNGRGWEAVGALQLLHSLLKACNGLLEDLSPGLALAIIVFAAVGLLSTGALLASWFHAITFLLT